MQDKKILPNIYIDNVILDLPNSHIYVSCLIDNEEKDFDLNQEKFEIFIDDNELRPYECFGFEWTDNQMPWNAIYENQDALYKLIEHYIEYLYIQKAFDLQTSIKNL